MAADITPETEVQKELAELHKCTDQLVTDAKDATSYLSECAHITRLAVDLRGKIQEVVQLTLNSSTVYHRPIHRIAVETTKNLDCALRLARKCGRSGIIVCCFCGVFGPSAVEFKKVLRLLESSNADFLWILSVIHCGGGIVVVPPIVRDDSVLSWAWSSIARLHVDCCSDDRITAASNIVSFEWSDQRYREVLVEEGAVEQLLQLLVDGGGCADGQVIAAAALCCLVENSVKRCRAIALDDHDKGIEIITKVLEESCLSVKIAVVELVSKIVEVNEVPRQELVREKLIDSLISCLIYDSGKYESAHNKHVLMTKASLILLRLCVKKLLNGRQMTELCRLFNLSSIIELESGDLNLNSLMTIKEVAEVAESIVEFRKAVWKRYSLPVKAVLHQLLRVINEECNPSLQILAIKAIGCLSRIFSAKESLIISALVKKLGDENTIVANEAVVTLTKFTCPENHNRVEHSKMVVEFGGVPLLMKFLSDSEHNKLPMLVLLCNLSIHAGDSTAFAKAQVRNTLVKAISSGMPQDTHLKNVISKAVKNLLLYGHD